ncbi:MAG: alpha/beta fold hydrolase, partial [Actinobacteria bacterium]|nr:alpha/beta fold hydrolase [Actinomycetota bacterium]
MKLSIEIFSPLPSRDPALRREIYEDILLIHGMGSASTAWSELLPKLRKNFRVITVDLPGHGKTPLTATSATDPIALAHLLHDEMVKIS